MSPYAYRFPVACRRGLIAAGALALCASVSAPALAATASSAQVNANASGVIGRSFGDLPGVTDTHHDGAAGVPGPLHAHSNVDVHGGTNNRVQAVADVSATWNDANSGEILAANSWEIDNFDQVEGNVFQATTIDQSLQRELPAWQYAFDATGNDNLFTLDANIIANGVGVGEWDLRILEDGNAVVGLHQLANGESFTQALLAGHHYQVTLTSNEGLAFISDGRQTSRNVSIDTSRFEWAISGQAGGGGGGVPEPAAWALMIAGFGLTGAALRRRAISRATT